MSLTSIVFHQARLLKLALAPGNGAGATPLDATADVAQPPTRGTSKALSQDDVRTGDDADLLRSGSDDDSDDLPGAQDDSRDDDSRDDDSRDDDSQGDDSQGDDSQDGDDGTDSDLSHHAIDDQDDDLGDSDSDSEDDVDGIDRDGDVEERDDRGDDNLDDSNDSNHSDFDDRADRDDTYDRDDGDDVGYDDDSRDDDSRDDDSHDDSHDDGALLVAGFALEVAHPGTPAAALERHTFEFGPGLSVLSDREWSDGRWKLEHMSQDESYRVVDLAGVRHVLKLETDDGEQSFSLYRDDNGDGVWTRMAEGEWQGPGPAPAQVDLIGLLPALSAADGLIG